MPPSNFLRTRKHTGQSATPSTTTAAPAPSRMPSKSATAKSNTKKRSADANTSIVQPQSKKPRVSGGAPQLGLTTTKDARKSREVRPPPCPGNSEDIINSDDELVGIFDDDDEEFRQDESEDDDLDHNIVIPRWATDGESGLRTTANQAARVEQETPVWQQPPPAQAPVLTIDNEVADQDHQPDQPDAEPPHPPPHHHQPPQAHRPPPHHALQLAEARWPETAQLVHPMRGGKWSLLAQSNSIQAVVQDAIPLVFRHIASVDSFPSGEDKVKVTRDSLYQAAENEGFNEIADRLSRDRNFGRWLSSLIDARVSILRGDVRDAASAAIASFHITDPDQVNEYLLQDLTYIYPVDPFSRKMQTNQPYRHPAIESIIQHAFFHGPSATTYDGIYHSSISELDEPEVPIPMVALAATAVHAALDDWGRDRGAFSASLYEDIYRRHIATLESIKTANVRALHAITGSIYRNCMRKSRVSHTVQPLALNIAELSTSFD